MRPAVAILVNELARKLVLDEDAEPNGTVSAFSLGFVVDPGAEDDAIAEGGVRIDDANRFGAGGMLPHAASRSKLEVCKDGCSDPEPRFARVANEAALRRHRPVTQTSAARSRIDRRTSSRLIATDELDLGARDLGNEIVDQLFARSRPHPHANTVETLVELARLILGARPPDAELPDALGAGLIWWSRGTEREQVTQMLPNDRFGPDRRGDDPIARTIPLANEGRCPLPGLIARDSGSNRPGSDELENRQSHDGAPGPGRESPVSLCASHAGPMLAGLRSLCSFAEVLERPADESRCRRRTGARIQDSGDLDVRKTERLAGRDELVSDIKRAA